MNFTKKLKRGLRKKRGFEIMFRFFKKKPLEIPLEKLKEDFVRLDLQVRNIEKEISDIENRIEQLFEEGKKAKTRSEELTIATRIKTLSQRKQNLQVAHAELNKQIMLVSNLIVIKENEEILKSSPFYDKLRRMSPEDLENALTKFRLDRQDLNEKLMLALEYTSQAMATGYEDDEEIKEILDTMRAVKEGELDPKRAAKRIEEVGE